MSKTPIFDFKDVKFNAKNNVELVIKKFNVHAGLIYGIGGPSGAGKTLMLDLLNRKLKPGSGEIQYNGKPFSSLSSGLMSGQFAYVPQMIKPPFGTVEKFMYKTLGKFSHITEPQKRIESILRRLEIKEAILEKKMRHLSPGQLRKVCLATAIAADPKILLIDEVELHTSQESLSLLLKILQKKCSYDGVTIILSSLKHDILHKVSSILVNIDNGKITNIRSLIKTAGRRGQRRPRQRKKPQG